MLRFFRRGRDDGECQDLGPGRINNSARGAVTSLYSNDLDPHGRDLSTFFRSLFMQEAPIPSRDFFIRHTSNFCRGELCRATPLETIPTDMSVIGLRDNNIS